MVDFRYFTPLTTLTEWKSTKSGVNATVDGAQVDIEILSLDAFRITITPAHGAPVLPQFAICGKLDPCEFKVTEDKKHVLISTKNFKVELTKKGFSINATRTDGSTIFKSSEGYYFQFNDSFAVTRLRPESDVILGLGEKTGRFNRAGKHYTLWNVDVL
ncbi:MAG TPA: hypothetical protein VK171_14470, partial [Fimbriimonas sp.]|nr:hypothetical protein [Fimbriimonas sp.]